MIRKGTIVVLIIAMTAVCSGCWDRTEINDIALVMASSLDLEEDGRYLGTLQMAIPARHIGNTSSKSKQYFVESGIGSSVQELVRNEQPKLSRRLFIAHRRVLFIGEKLARHGIKDVLDHFGRNPTTRLRTYVVVVKGGEGKDALNIDYPLEFVPTEAVREMENLVNSTAVTMRDLLASASGEGIQPIMGVIELKPSSEKVKMGDMTRKTFDLSGTAVFKDLKLSGYLNPQNTQLMLWVTGKLKNGMMSVMLPEQKGKVSIRLTGTVAKINPTVDSGKVKFTIHLKGKGTLEESKGALDYSNPKNLQVVENALENSLRKNTKKMIEDVQKKYNSDIFGFGEVLHKKNNKAWQSLRLKWDESFAQAEFTVDAEIAITRAGMTGPPLQLHEQEIIK